MQRIGLDGLFTELDGCRDVVRLDRLSGLLERLDLSNGQLERHVRFSDDGYRRNLVRLGPGYAALILCWRPGQASPLHDHRGSACAVRVIQGVASERRYRREADGRLVVIGESSHPEGSVCGSYDADIHTVFNAQPAGLDLVTLHVYTPPMLRYCTYSLDSPEVRECADREVLAERRRRRGGVAPESAIC